MSIFLKLCFLFSVGSIIGWGIEVVWRKSMSKSHRWINPGFLTGPYLPLYGFSLCVLYLLAHINVSFVENPVLKKIVLFVLMSIAVTFIEYLAGLIFIKGMKIKLWDYSDRLGNIQGIICPLYSFFWIILSATYYFFVHPRILGALDWLSNHITFSFAIGFFYGVLIVDFVQSLNVVAKIKKFADEKQIVVKYEAFKSSIPGRKYMSALHAERARMAEHLENYLESERIKFQTGKAEFEKKIAEKRNKK